MNKPEARSDSGGTPDDARFDVVSDHGCDAFPTLANDPIVIPFVVQVGEAMHRSTEMPLADVFDHLADDGPHPSTSQPAPQVYADSFNTATRPVVAVTVSSALSGSMNAANQGRSLVPDVDVTLHDSGTVSAAQSFQVHAAMRARALGQDLATAVQWMRKVHEETEFYFTLATLTYLLRGGRIGRVQATLGTVLDLKPVVTVDKTVGAYVTAARARGWKSAIRTIARQVTTRFGEGTPLRVGLVHGLDRDDAEAVLANIAERHPILWSDLTPTGAALAVHVGPIAVGLAVAPGPWPWEREA